MDNYYAISYSFKFDFWNFVDPTKNLALVITIGLIIAIASATQDITVDALRIEQIGKNEGKSMQAGAAIAVVGWWTGYKLGGVVALNSAEYFSKNRFRKLLANYFFNSWHYHYCLQHWFNVCS